MAPLRGRGSELEVLHGVIAATRDGRGGVVVVEGAPGMGKTRLLDEACQMAVAEGLVVARGNGDELDQVTPWGVLLGALSSSDPSLVDPAGVDALRGLSDQRLAVIDQMRAELEVTSSQQPVLIALDDLQWADGPTLLASGLLPVQLFSYPVAWLFALRGFPASSSLDRVLERLDKTGASRLHLAPLESSAAAELARDIAGSHSQEHLSGVVSSAEGNPLYIIELLRVGAAQRSGRVRAVASGVPPAVRTAIVQQLSSLSDPARQLLRVASVLGREFSVAEVAAMTASPASMLVPAVEETLRAEILLELAERLAFRHDLLRQAVYESLPGSVRIALHRDAAEVLRQTGASPARVAGQLAIGAQPGDGYAIDAMREAVGELASASPKAAADLAMRVLGLVAEDDDRRLGVVQSAARALMSAGRVDEAVAVAGRHLASHRPPAQVEAVWQLELRSAWAFARYQPYPSPVSEQLLDDPSVDPAVQAALAALVRASPIWPGPTGDAERALEDAVRITRESGRPFEFTLVAQLEVVRLALRGRLEEALAKALAAREVARSLGDSSVLPVHESLVAAQLICAGRVGEALETVRAAAEAAGPAQRVVLEARDEWTLTAILLSQGRLDDAYAGAATQLEVVVELGYFSGVSSPLARLVETSVRRGEVSEAHAAVMRYGRVAEGMRNYTHYAAALVGDARGNRAAVAEALEPIVADLELGGFDAVIAQPHRIPLLVHVAHRAGASEVMRSIAQAAQTLAGLNPHVDCIQAAAANAQAIVENDIGLLREAVGLAARSESRLLEAAAREDLGLMLSAAAPGEAIEQLEAAYSFYVHAGAHRDVARVRAALRKLGVRKRQTSVARPRHGWESLTRSERVVVELVGRGLTNREAAAELFLSPDTINTHLRHAFAKLGVRSRVELARMAAQREQVPG